MILLREKIDEVDTTGQSVRITPCSTETMAPYLNPLLMAAVVWVCLSAGAIAESTVEQQLQQLKDNYVEMQQLLAEKDRRLDALERENVKSKKTLEAQVTRLEAKTRRMEIEAIEQKSQLTALQQQNALRSGTRAEIATRQATTPIIPRSCANVQCNGNTVSGLYPIMGTSSVEMVFCDFTKATTDANFQRRIGYVDVKTAPVYFYVQKNNSFATAYVPIPFEVARVNIGGAMNLTSGTFTAPRAGTYFFSYTGDARFVGPSTNIMAVLVEMLLNGQRVGTARVTESNTSGSVHSQMSMQSTLTLKAGDRIWLQIGFMTAGGVAYVYDNPNADQRFNHFTGWLVEENFAGLF
ncbi:C1q and tumor necrosis factor-related protein 2 [Daphnia sinensis]|uniref:C1q and tumor necrosis factor-related protein 2 n=1 Tax=Daphnia sinensis TaxID=1820382 RepID=A0AAD5PWG9_9CRUS|nr:C1q and tumor necrosis factor-related protein 2 [Daphnia sinensis]